MYNAAKINELIQLIEKNNGIADKGKLADLIQNKFSLTQDRKVYYCNDFAIRFSKSEKKRMSNTVLSLSALQKYDSKPFIVCIVATNTNYLLLANTSFLTKISHSSKELRMDNIKGSFNGGDIMETVGGIENTPENFEKLFAFHLGFTFEENLERLVESTNSITGRVHKFEPNNIELQTMNSSIDRAESFIKSNDYVDLKNDLANRVKSVQGEIAIAALIDNVNIRGRVIEYLITDNGSSLKDQIIDALRNKKPIMNFKTEDKLGDYSKEYPSFSTETDIKTKVMFLDGNPKAYNVDKLLRFLASQKSVYMIYLLGIDKDGKIIARLCSVFDKRLVEATNIMHHWAGRNSRGVAQFIGSSLTDILLSEDKTIIKKDLAEDFLGRLVNA